MGWPYEHRRAGDLPPVPVLPAERGVRPPGRGGGHGRLHRELLGLTGWTTGLMTALGNYQANVAAAFSDMAMSEEDVIEAGDEVVIRSVITAAHTGEFLGIAPTGRTVSYDAVDMYRVAGGRIVWRFLMCDWKGVADQLTGPAR